MVSLMGRKKCDQRVTNIMDEGRLRERDTPMLLPELSSLAIQCFTGTVGSVQASVTVLRHGYAQS